MKTLFTNLSLLLFAVTNLQSQNIPMEKLHMSLREGSNFFSKNVLENEISGIEVAQISITEKPSNQQINNNTKCIYLFIKGNGSLLTSNKKHSLEPETIFLPNQLTSFAISANKKDTLHFLKISSTLTKQDLKDIKDFPRKNTEEIYLKKFSDCEPYTEPIKSPNTVSRTILPNKYIPRIAMGTVKTKGPDKVGAHEHGMLEQLFLGLSKNEVTVYADSASIKFPEYSLLHIPLGSTHSVTVEDGAEMYYVWMDFFRDKAAEAWLETHNAIKKEEE